MDSPLFHSIVDQSEGFIKVDTEIGRGTEFMLFFKAQQAEAESDFFEEPVETPEEFGETVLLVEDDDTVRSITGSMLRRRGYKVLEAKNGGEAILLAEMQDENIHLLITDYILPLLNGDELSRRIRKLLPEIKTIIMTAEPDAENKIVCKDGDNFFIIKKPFEVSGFNDIVRKALEA